MYLMCQYLFQEDQTLQAAFYGLAFSILGSFGFSFLISSFVVFPVQERESKVSSFTTLQCVYEVDTFCLPSFDLFVHVLIQPSQLSCYNSSIGKSISLDRTQSIACVSLYTCTCSCPMLAWFAQRAHLFSM